MSSGPTAPSLAGVLGRVEALGGTVTRTLGIIDGVAVRLHAGVAAARRDPAGSASLPRTPAAALAGTSTTRAATRRR